VILLFYKILNDKKMTKYKLQINILLALFMIALVSCNGGKTSTEPAKEAEVIPEDIVEMRADQIKLANVETGSIEMLALSATLKVNGIVTVAPQNFATVCAPMGGFIKSTTLMPGMAVSKGQTLVVIENQEFVDVQQNYLETKNKLEYATAEFKRHTELYKEDVYSEKNVQQVTTDYKNLQAQVKGLEQKLALIGLNIANLHEDDISSSVNLVSPISGYVTKVNVNLGKFVTPADVLFEIVNRDKLLLELTLFDKDANKIIKGQKARFFINNETDQHEAVIYQTGQSINADKTFKVYASIPDTCKNVLPGMYVNVIIETSGDLVTALPSEAVVSFDDKDYIFVYDKEKVEAGNPFTEYRIVPVQKGVSDGGFTQIILPEGFDTKAAKVVIKGAYNLLSAKKNAGEMAC
jgi:RND family efflux transporter MFP subunit